MQIQCRYCNTNCQMTYEPENGNVSGNACIRGITYAKNFDPTALTVRKFKVELINGFSKHLLVETNQPISMLVADQLEQEIKTAKISAPVSFGERVLINIANTGIDLLASRKMKARK